MKGYMEQTENFFEKWTKKKLKKSKKRRKI